MRISDWSSDVCSSDLSQHELALFLADEPEAGEGRAFMDDTVSHAVVVIKLLQQRCEPLRFASRRESADPQAMAIAAQLVRLAQCVDHIDEVQKRGFELDQIKRSEEHTSELQSLMRNSYAVS